MDLKALMQKLAAINTTQIVAESVETKQVITESVARQVVNESAEPVFKSSIARSLAEEFGYALGEADPNDPNKSAAVDANTKAMQAKIAAKDGTTVQGSGTTPPPGAAPATKPAAAPAPAGQAAPAAGGVANPYQGADAAKFASMSPKDQEWLTRGGGKPDINDEFILRRAPNGGKAVAAPAPAPAPAPAGGPAVPPGGVQAQGDDDGNTMITKPDGTTQVVGPDGKPLANGGRVDPAGGATKPAEVPAGINPETGEKYTSVADAPLELPPGAEPEAGMTVAGDKAKPAAAKPKIMAKPDPAVIKIQQDLIAQGAKIKADGVMGDATRAAMKQFPGVAGIGGAKPAGAPAAGAKPDELAAVKKNAGMPAAAAPAAAAPAAAAPAAGSAPAKTFAQDTAARKAAALTAPAAGTTSTQSNQSVQGTMKMGKPDGPITFNGKQVQPGEPEYAAASQALIASSQKAQQARQRPGSTPAPTGNVAMGATNADKRDFEESIQAKDDQILAIIRDIRVG